MDERCLELRTTIGRNKLIARPTQLDGVRGLGYYEHDQLVGFVPAEKVNEKMYMSNIPCYKTVGKNQYEAC